MIITSGIFAGMFNKYNMKNKPFSAVTVSCSKIAGSGFCGLLGEDIL